MRDLYICDPEKCPDCRKTGCHNGMCYHTTEKEQRARGFRRLIFWIQYKFNK